ncbi:MAG: ATP-binding protein [Candidatus Helarchaeota archaeon]
MNEAFNYQVPCSEDLFVGRDRLIKQFEENLSKDVMKSIFIKGRPGIGKSSLMKKMASIARSKGFLILNKQVPLQESEAFFDQLLPEIKDIFKPKKPVKPGKKKLGKNCPLIKKTYEIIDEEKYMIQFLKKFCNNKILGFRKDLTKKAKKGIVIFVDNVERFIFLASEKAFDLFNEIVKKFEETDEKKKIEPTPIIFVLFGEERYAPKIEYSLSDFELTGIPKISYKEAFELLSKRETKAAIQIEDQVKNKLIENSQGIPQLLLYNTSKLIEESGSREIKKSQWEAFESIIKDGFNNEFKGISENERKILQAFAMEPANFADVDMLMRATSIERENILNILNSLAQSGRVSNEGENYFITMNAFWEYLRDSLGDIAIAATCRAMIKIAENDAINGRIIDENLFNELEMLRKDSIAAGLVSPIELIARGYERIASLSMNFNYSAEAYKYYLLASESYLKVNELEKAAIILEEAGYLYKNKGLGDYSRDILLKAIEKYELLQDTEKIKEIKTEVAENSLNKATKSIEEGAFPLARANFTRAQKFYSEIGEEGRSLEILDKAASLFFEKEEYYYAWQYFSRIINFHIEKNDESKAKDAFETANKKFSSANLSKFVNKLNDDFSKKIGVSV